MEVPLHPSALWRELGQAYQFASSIDASEPPMLPTPSNSPFRPTPLTLTGKPRVIIFTSSAEVNPTTYVGQSIRRLEDHRLLIGNGLYLDDLKVPGLLHAAVLRSPHAHASILSIDTSRARQLPGVVSVITTDDLAGIATEIPTRTRADADEIHPPSIQCWPLTAYATWASLWP